MINAKCFENQIQIRQMQKSSYVNLFLIFCLCEESKQAKLKINLPRDPLTPFGTL